MTYFRPEVHAASHTSRIMGLSYTDSFRANCALDDGNGVGLQMFVDPLRALESAELLQGVQWELLPDLAAHAVERRYGAGQVLFRQGEDGDEALVLASGSVDIV